MKHGQEGVKEATDHRLATEGTLRLRWRRRLWLLQLAGSDNGQQGARQGDLSRLPGPSARFYARRA